VTRFRIIPASSSVSTETRSSVHSVHAESRALTGSIEGQLDEDGLPQFEAPHHVRIQVPV
jgi:hypothetical protein